MLRLGLDTITIVSVTGMVRLAAMLPIGDYVMAQVNSKYYKRGDRKWQNKNVDTETYLELMETVVRCIASKWPRGQWSDPQFKVRIQHDGAPAHKSKAFREGWEQLICQLWVEGVLPNPDKIRLEMQPPNSPDLNINDLGLFNALQARYERSNPKNSIQLIDCVLKAWNECPWKKIDYLFITLQAVLNEIIMAHGRNDYELPHLSKGKLDKAGQLPIVLKVTPEAPALFDAFASPDFTEEDLCMEYDDPLPGRVSQKELRELLSDADAPIERVEHGN